MRGRGELGRGTSPCYSVPISKSSNVDWRYVLAGFADSVSRRPTPPITFTGPPKSTGLMASTPRVTVSSPLPPWTVKADPNRVFNGKVKWITSSVARVSTKRESCASSQIDTRCPANIHVIDFHGVVASKRLD